VVAELFKNPDGVALAYARNSWQASNGGQFPPKTRAFGLALRILFGNFKLDLDGLADVGQRFIMRLPRL